MFDITFFFFIIVILLAIIQGKYLSWDCNFQDLRVSRFPSCNRFDYWCFRRIAWPVGQRFWKSRVRVLHMRYRKGLLWFCSTRVRYARTKGAQSGKLSVSSQICRVYIKMFYQFYVYPLSLTGSSWCIWSTNRTRSTRVKRPMYGTCTSNVVGTSSQSETASANNTKWNWVEERARRKDKNTTPISFPLFAPLLDD